MSVLEMFDMLDQSKRKGEAKLDKVKLIDLKLRFVREVDGSVEHVTWFIDVDRLTNFMQKHFSKQTRWGLFFCINLHISWPIKKNRQIETYPTNHWYLLKRRFVNSHQMLNLIKVIKIKKEWWFYSFITLFLLN